MFQKEFHATYATVAWTMYGLHARAGHGHPAHRLGRRPVRHQAGPDLMSLVLFVGRLAWPRSLAWDIGPLIAFRALQGLGGGMLMPLGMTIMTRAAGPGPGRPCDGGRRWPMPLLALASAARSSAAC